MVHELIGIAFNRVDLRHVPGVKPEFAEAVLSARQDPFFRANMHANFGDLGMAVKEMVDAASRWAFGRLQFGTRSSNFQRPIGAVCIAVLRQRFALRVRPPSLGRPKVS
jgi:hypothetical protein